LLSMINCNVIKLEVMGDVEQVAMKNAEASGGSFTKTNSMAEAFEGADIVYPKSWAPYAAMEKRTELYSNGDDAGIKALETVYYFQFHLFG